MYGHSRLRERNQVTIPPFVVEKMNLKPDDIVEFVLNDKGTIELHPAKIVKMGSPGARLEEVLAVQEIKRGDYAEIRDADDLRQYVEKVRTGGGSSAETNAAPADTKPAFAVMLRTVGASKINVVNAVREITKLGLKEAKELVDAAPKIVKEVVSKDEAEKIEKKFVQAGATVEIQNATAPEEVGSLVEFEITLPAEITGSQTVTVQCKGRVVRAGTSNNEESGVYHITDPHIGNRYDEIAKDCE
jgi:large subunit ribosomal protein L7/L12